MKALLTGLVLVVILPGCSMTLPVRGTMGDGEEFFTGTATGYMSGSGNLEIRSQKGVTCRGDFVYVTSRQGEGVVSCSDGRSGAFTFASTGTNGTGRGTVGGKDFYFTFGGLPNDPLPPPSAPTPAPAKTPVKPPGSVDT